MTENEFIKELQYALYGNVPDRVLDNNIRFYREYFADQRANGLRDEEICDSIGNPGLIAKTVIETISEDNYYRSASEAGMTSGPSSVYGGVYWNGHQIKLKWYTKLLLVLIPILILLLVIMLFLGLLHLAIRLFLPILVICLVWQFLGWLIKKI